MKDLNKIALNNIKNSNIGSFNLVSKIDNPVDIVASHVFGQWRYYAISKDGRAMLISISNSDSPFNDSKVLAKKYLSKFIVGYSAILYTDNGSPTFYGSYK